MALKRIYEYLDYREFLRDFYMHKKSTTKYFSYRYFNMKAGIKSPSLLKQVIDGERKLSPTTTEKFIKGLSLRKREAEYFQALVKFNQSKKTEEKTENIEKILNHSGAKKAARLDRSKYELYKDWWNLAIREMVGLAGFKEDPKWIPTIETAGMHYPAAYLETAARVPYELGNRNSKVTEIEI